MSEVKLSAALPKGDSDGLGPMVSDAIGEPETVHTLLILVDTKKIVTDVDTDESIPVLRIRRAEVIRGGDIKDAKRLIRRAIEKRTGQATLDLEVETELEAMFRSMDLKEDEQPKPIGGNNDGDEDQA